MTKQVDPTSARIGDVLEFRLTVANHGSMPAENISVQDILPDYLDILSITSTRGKISVEGQTVVVVIGTLQPSDIITIQIRARISDRNPPSIGYNTARISTTSPTNDPSNDADTAIFRIVTTTTTFSNTTPVPIPPMLPRTGAADDLLGNQSELALLGLLLLVSGWLMRRRLRRRT